VNNKDMLNIDIHFHMRKMLVVLF